MFHKLIHIRQIQDVGYITGREAAHPTPDRWVALAIVLPNSQLRCWFKFQPPTWERDGFPVPATVSRVT